MNNQVWGIGGMTCAACARRLEKAIGKLDGVESVTVNLASEKAAVIYDPQKIKSSTIKKTVQKTGFKAYELSMADGAGTRKQKEIRKMWIKFITAAVFCLPLLYLAMVPMISFVNPPFPEVLEPTQHPLAYAIVQLSLVTPILLSGYKNRQREY